MQREGGVSKEGEEGNIAVVAEQHIDELTDSNSFLLFPIKVVRLEGTWPRMQVASD